MSPDPQIRRCHASKYHKIDCDGAQVDALLVALFIEAHERAPREIVLDLDNTDIPLPLDLGAFSSPPQLAMLLMELSEQHDLVVRVAACDPPADRSGADDTPGHG
jgi:hypothetical protein